MRSVGDTGPLQPGDPRLIMRWARRYAKSRTISFLVQWVFIVVMVVIIGVAANLTSMAYRTENMGLFSVAVATMVLSIVGLTWFSVSPWGGEVIYRITQWLYGSEGYVEYAGDQRDGPMPLWLTALGGGLVIYHLVGALLVSFRWLSFEHMQPYSALYMAPFLMVLIVYQRLGFWAWFWPVLYLLHAGLLLAGFPVSFRGKWMILNMVVPVFAYGLVAILIGHIYSRYALLNLKRVAQQGLQHAPLSDDDDTVKDA